MVRLNTQLKMSQLHALKIIQDLAGLVGYQQNIQDLMLCKLPYYRITEHCFFRQIKNHSPSSNNRFRSSAIAVLFIQILTSKAQKRRKNAHFRLTNLSARAQQFVRTHRLGARTVEFL